jgi:hypothetical protein
VVVQEYVVAQKGVVAQVDQVVQKYAVAKEGESSGV